MIKSADKLLSKGRAVKKTDKTLLIFLQNAYGVEDGYTPSYEKDSFANCHTGRRLKEMIPDGFSVIIRNANPTVGKTADSNFPPDYNYVKSIIDSITCDVILACGKNAREAMSQVADTSKVVYAPHPAYRALSKKITSNVRESILREASNGEY